MTRDRALIVLQAARERITPAERFTRGHYYGHRVRWCAVDAVFVEQETRGWCSTGAYEALHEAAREEGYVLLTADHEPSLRCLDVAIRNVQRDLALDSVLAGAAA